MTNLTRFFAGLGILAGLLSCGVSDQAYTLSEWESVDYSGAIRVSLAHPYNREFDDYELLFASSMETESLGLCVDDEQPSCQVGGTGYFPSLLVYSDGERKFFRTDSSALLEEGLVLNVLATDATGQMIDQRKIKFERSGSDTGVPGNTAGTPSNPGGLGGIISQVLGNSGSTNTGTNTGNATAGNTASNTNPATDTTQTPPAAQTTSPDADVKAVVQRNCGGCHADYAANPATLKGTDAASQVQSGSMPPGRAMPGADKTALLDFLR